ncbi:S1C family serine protease [Ktedonospora formicarum]|uniref:Trypsin-like serine protease n=1 Tax=Ktedonospora formicarum TaxID=2778364 RepID=A0A8J3I743_9CHLR|nr:trypsin-like peptidase domain-containing protein [Ktedonospora formicarum]GHO46654.1 hypothetical protein KSX_48170 [Ktedonospora formicarum]
MYDPNARNENDFDNALSESPERTKITEPTPSLQHRVPYPDRSQSSWPLYYYEQPTLGAPPRTVPTRQGSVLNAVLLTLLCATIFGAILFGAGWVFGRNSTIPSQEALHPIAVTTMGQAREMVVNKVQPSIVQITGQQTTSNSVGTGVIIDKRGYIVTNNHVIRSAITIRVQLPNGKTVPGEIIGSEPDYDLAIIKVETTSPLTAIMLGDSSQLHVGQDVLAIGNPLGISRTVTSGIVSAVNRTISEGHGTTLHGAVQTDAPINPGNSGGALVDMQGNLVGIPTLTAINPEFNTPANGMGFAVPSNKVKEIMEKYLP